jgi:hypothetical protein
VALPVGVHCRLLQQALARGQRSALCIGVCIGVCIGSPIGAVSVLPSGLQLRLQPPTTALALLSRPVVILPRPLAFAPRRLHLHHALHCAWLHLQLHLHHAGFTCRLAPRPSALALRLVALASRQQVICAPRRLHLYCARLHLYCARLHLHGARLHLHLSFFWKPEGVAPYVAYGVDSVRTPYDTRTKHRTEHRT